MTDKNIKPARDISTAALISLEELVEALQPLGINAARALIQRDPRLPKPIGVVQKPALFAGDQARAYLDRVARDGFPHEAKAGGKNATK